MDDFTVIETQIRQEQEDAVKVFRQKDFRALLQARLQTEAGHRPKQAFRLRKWTPVFAVALLLVASAIVVISLAVHHPQVRPGLAVTRFLEQSANIQRISSLRQQENEAPEEKSSRSSDLDRTILTFLSSAGPGRAAVSRGAVIPGGPKDIPRYDLEKRFEILFLRKTVYQFLKTYLSDREEVSNDPQKLPDSLSFSAYDAALSSRPG